MLNDNNINCIIIGHLNVNSFADKYDSMKLIIPGNIDVVVNSFADKYDSMKLIIPGNIDAVVNSFEISMIQ